MYPGSQRITTDNIPLNMRLKIRLSQNLWANSHHEQKQTRMIISDIRTTT